MAASGHSCRKPLVSTGWAISLLLCTNGLRKWSSGHVYRACISGSEGSIGATIGQEPIASSLDSGCGLSLKCVQVGCNGTCVKLNRAHNAQSRLGRMAQKPSHREELKLEKNHYDVTQGSVSAMKVCTVLQRKRAKLLILETFSCSA